MDAELQQSLTALLGRERVSFGESIVDLHSRDESYHTPHRPDAVVFAQSEHDVVSTVHFARQHRIPLIPYGAGTSLEGHTIPVRGGITIDFSRMNRILEIRPDDFLVHVQAGVTRQQLNDALGPHGLFFPVDPGANATLGGMAASGASGTTTVRYGTMRHNVRSLSVVLADGSLLQTASLASKSSSGYALTPLFVGSEGTLGIFTSLWLTCYGIPTKTIAAIAEFPSVEACVRTSTALIGIGLPVVRVELMTPRYLAVVNQQLNTDYEEVPTLFLEFSGTPESLAADVEQASAIAEAEGCTHFHHVSEDGARRALWNARHNAAYAMIHAHPGLKHMSTDVCVPISRLPEAVLHAERLIDEYHIRGGLLGHVGDGNFHVSMMVQPADPREMQEVQEFHHRIVTHALALEGTCTGEHGVGLGKMRYQEAEHGAALGAMWAIKNALDPLGILNPGKKLPPLPELNLTPQCS
ncbi:FAD-binding oxidoreductase [Alicyclobacillus sp. SP_1]|uniref:FAD-binding oxidoreductase n=1 Tax=Alicyclobacillus sp. SP_1 TaxID=2942475 RepID=UPI002157AE12|nr:FAD-linked oxidase C-terminal domain-containing protein [Alicyclobacillus sp. SP_1]